MNHGGLGYIDAQGNLILPPELLESLSVTHGSILFCMYYPKPSNRGLYRFSTLIHDFMLTPVPERFWPRSARFEIRLKQKPGTLKSVSAFLARNKVSILRAECTRSGYRYATWNMDIVFEDIKDDELVFDRTQSLFPATLNRIKDLEAQMRKKCKSALFIDKNDFILKDPIKSFPHTALAYYHNKSNASNKNMDSILSVPFEVYYRGDGVLLTSKSTPFQNALKLINRHESVDTSLSTIIFAELNSKDMNIRVAPITKTANKRFFEAEIVYRRISKPDTCVGIISNMLKYVNKNYNLWRLYNYSKINEELHELGVISMLVEDFDDTKESYPQYIDKATRNLATITNMHIAEADTVVTDVKVYPITYRLVVDRLGRKVRRRKAFTHDVFVSYSSLNLKEARKIRSTLADFGLRSYMAEKELGAGDIFSEEIRSALLDSRECCVLYTPQSSQSIWVQTEWGAFWALDKRITPILFGLDESKLDDRLRHRQAIHFHNLSKYAEEVWERRFPVSIPLNWDEETPPA